MKTAKINSRRVRAELQAMNTTHSTDRVSKRDYSRALAWVIFGTIAGTILTFVLTNGLHSY